MKKYIALLFVFLMIPFCGFSQEDTKEDDTTTEKVKEKLERRAFESSFIIDNPTNVLFNTNALEVTMQHRFGTVNGYSPNLRTDLVINAMTLSSLEQNKIFVSNGNIRRSLLGIDDLCNAIEKIVITKNIKSDVYNIISCSYAIVELAKKIQSINGCELVVNDSLSTSYSFTVTNEKFESEFKFKFVDTVDSIYRNLINNIDQIKIKSNRTNLPSCYV